MGSIHVSQFYLFKAGWLLYVQAPSAINKSTFCIYGFCMILSANYYYVLKIALIS
jgi:hypothetical protein